MTKQFSTSMLATSNNKTQAFRINTS